MKHKLFRMSIRDYDDACQYARSLDGWTAQGYKVISCGLTESGRCAWAILQKDDEEGETDE